MTGTGRPGEGPKCRETLGIGDDFGDYSSTHRCQHRGWHWTHRERWDDGNGNDVVLTWRRQPGFYRRWVCAEEGCDWQAETMCRDLAKKLRDLAKAVKHGGFVQSDDVECINEPGVHRDRDQPTHAYVMATFEIWR